MANSDLILAPGESSVVGSRFTPSLSLFWLKTQVAVTNRRIVWKSPNTILGAVPLGYAEHSMPIGAIASVSVNTRVRVGRLVFGFILFIVSLALFATGSGGGIFFGLVFLIIAGLALANSATAELTATNNGGGAQSFSVSVLERSRLEQYTNEINTILYSGGAGGGYGAPPQMPGYGANPQGPGFGGHPQVPGFGGHPQAPGFGGHPQAPGFGGHPQP